MANYATLKAAVTDVVKTNGEQAITGANLQSVLLSIINSLGGGGYIFKGVATPSTSAGTPDQNVFYIGGAGTYANFDTSVTVPVGTICVFKYSGSWTHEQVELYPSEVYFLNTYNYDSLAYEKDFFACATAIPVADRHTPCVVYHRKGNVWQCWMYRGNSSNSDVSDTYWSNPVYWTNFVTGDMILDIATSAEKSYNYTKNDYTNSLVKEIHIDGNYDANLKYFIRSCRRRRSIGTYPDSFYFAIQSYDPATEERTTICEFGNAENIERSGVYTSINGNYRTTILLTLENQTDNTGSIYLHDYDASLEINDICWGSTIDNAPIIANHLAIHGADSSHVDLLIFMGQSNMAGRGVVNSSHPEQAPNVIEGAGYEYRAVSDPTRLYPISEPFGVAENNQSGINDGTKKTGSLVSSFVNAYYCTCGKVVVAVSASQGGTTSTNWLPSGILLPDAVQRLTDAVAFLQSHGYVVDHKYMVWCQGESDGDEGQSAATYITNFRNILDTMKIAGIEKCFLIRIGKYNGQGTTDYSTIINAQNELCQDNDDIVMASTALASFKEKGLMKDDFHYYQDAYNIVGTYAGRNAGLYRLYGIGKPQYDVMTNSLFFTDKDY